MVMPVRVRFRYAACLNVTPTAGVTLLGGVRWLSVSSALCWLSLGCVVVLVELLASPETRRRQSKHLVLPDVNP